MVTLSFSHIQGKNGSHWNRLMRDEKAKEYCIVAIARTIQKNRYQSSVLNGNIPIFVLMATSSLTENQLHRIQTICFNEKWSNRTQAKLIKVARTIADLASEEKIDEKAIQEAVNWKRLASSFQDVEIEKLIDG